MQEVNLYHIFLSRLNHGRFDYMVTGSVGSSKHLTDIQGMLGASYEAIDHQQLRLWVEKKNLQKEWGILTSQ